MKKLWVHACASVIGAGHISESIPCQDFARFEDFEGFSIAVICDGAGSCQNSHLGSKYVGDKAVEVFEKLISQSGWVSTIPTESLWSAMAIKGLRKVRDELERYSINSELGFKSLSCTIILVVSFHEYLLVAHIGDGRAGYCDMNGEWFAMITPFRGVEVNETVFITSDIWSDQIIDFYLKTDIVKTKVSAFCLLSDGCEKASFECNLYDSEKEQYFDPNRPYSLFFNPNVKILEQCFSQKLSQEDINSNWATFLTDGNSKLKQESDDKSLILAVNTSLTIENAAKYESPT